MVIDDDIKAMFAQLLIMMRLGIDDRPLCEFGGIQVPDGTLLDLQEFDEGQIVRPFDRVNAKDHGLLDLPPEKALQGKSACHGIRVGINDHGHRILRGYDLEEPLAPFGDGG